MAQSRKLAVVLVLADQFALGYLLRFWLSFEILAGWILTGLIVAGFAGIVRRE